jgi:hypothetical protein
MGDGCRMRELRTPRVFLFKRTSRCERDAGAGKRELRPDTGLGPDVWALGLPIGITNNRRLTIEDTPVVLLLHLLSN